MKTLTACVVAALAVSAIGNAFAADASRAAVTRDFTDTVAPPQQAAYEAGEKAWNQCLKDHGVKFSVHAVNHETGDTYEYSYEIGPYTWADFDTFDAQSKPCDAVWRAQGNPNLKSETSGFVVNQPDMSHLAKGFDKQPPAPLYHIIYYTLKPGHDAQVAFTTTVKKITAAANKSGWPYYWWTDQLQGAGEGAPDYMLVIPLKSWAENGEDPDPPLWKMVAGVYGKAAADTLRKTLNDAIQSSSDHFDRYNADLSYIAGK
jgi:hypothetical protein